MGTIKQQLRIGIIGMGYVGKAVFSAFSTNGVSEIVTVDPKCSDQISDTHTPIAITFDRLSTKLHNFNQLISCDCIFVCIPATTQTDPLSQEMVAMFEIANGLRLLNYTGVVIIKSTLPLSFTDIVCNTVFRDLKYAVNPEFLTEARAYHDFLDPSQIVIGVQAEDQDTYDFVMNLYNNYSYVKRRWYIRLLPFEAVAYKIFINVALATKVSMINEMRTLFSLYSNMDWNDFANKLRQDPRFGLTHIYSPGPDGSVGYGGKCLPGSVATFVQFAKEHALQTPTIAGAAATNKAIRK